MCVNFCLQLDRWNSLKSLISVSKSSAFML